MRVLLFLAVSVALLCSLALADHHKGEGKKSGEKDNHKKKDDSHEHGHHRGGHGHHHHDGHHRHHHHKKHHHKGNETLACHKLAGSNSKFAFDLFKQVTANHPSENVVFSPISISIALALLSLGAKDKTHDQILEGLRFNTTEIPEQDIHEAFHHLLEVLNEEDGELHLDSGNGLFISQEYKILEEFLNNTKNLYDSEAFTIDFQNNEEAKKQINSYVEKQTHGKIKEVLSSVSKNAALVMVNYMYFRGEWEKPFNEKFTKEKEFHVSKDQTVTVPFLSRTGFYNVAFLDDAVALSIPYKGNTSALFILPNEGKLEEVEANFYPLLKRWKKSKHLSLVDLSIPKFSISGSLDLKEVLSNFGIVDVFSDSANLSGITGAPNLKISKAVHKAQVNVDEKGTEAAATTVMEAIPMMLPPHVEYNRPFLFTIYNHEVKSSLFMGKIANPKN